MLGVVHACGLLYDYKKDRGEYVHTNITYVVVMYIIVVDDRYVFLCKYVMTRAIGNAGGKCCYAGLHALFF